jgi:hypothetical protein
MVQFEEDTRAALFDAGVLALDDNGKTVFTGLTAAETRFVLEYDAAEQPSDAGKSCHFKELISKFHTARELRIERVEKLATQQLNQYRSHPH